jgi:peptidoglycan/LPS O-acetylase OafA/YrhL
VALTMQRLSRLYTPGERNSIGFLRFLLAAMVIFSHAYQIGALGIDPLARRSDVHSGHVAVFAFFVLSGFLIARSFATTGTLPRYLWHRCLRILPAYWICLLFVAFAVAPLLYYSRSPAPTLSGFLAIAPDAPAQYVTRNFFLAQNQKVIGHLLDGLPHSTLIDGSLWTLPYEFLCYLMVGALGIFGLWTRHKRLGCLVVVAIGLVCLVRYNFPGRLPLVDRLLEYPHAASFATWFCTGALAYLLADHIPLHPVAFVVAVAGCVLALRAHVFHQYAQIPLAYVVFCLAAWLPLSWWDRWGDFSYGLYIYAWPLQELLAVAGVQRAGLLAFVTASLFASLAAAVLSYWLVEKPALSLKGLRWSRTRRRG